MMYQKRDGEHTGDCSTGSDSTGNYNTGDYNRKEPEDYEYVLVNKYIPDIYVELMYATDNNFTGVRIYDFTDAYLRYGTVKKLANVQKELKEQGYSLKIWDAYRPFEAQQKLWEVYPDPNYVANPADGMKSIILEEQ